MDSKFATQGALISFIGEMQEEVTIDSDFVLKKAVQLAIDKFSHSEDKEVTLRLLVLIKTSFAGISSPYKHF